MIDTDEHDLLILAWNLVNDISGNSWLTQNRHWRRDAARWRTALYVKGVLADEWGGPMTWRDAYGRPPRITELALCGLVRCWHRTPRGPQCLRNDARTMIRWGWGVISSVSGGDWGTQSDEWLRGLSRFRRDFDAWNQRLRAAPNTRGH